MPSAIKPIPLRMPADVRAKVQAYAATHGLSEHKAILALVGNGLGLDSAPPARKATSQKSENRIITSHEFVHGSPPKLDTSMVPQAGTFKVSPMQKTAPGRGKWKL